MDELISVSKKVTIKKDETPGVNTPDEEKEEALRRCYDWFEADRNAKKPVVDEWEECYKIYKGDHWDLMGANGSVLRSNSQKAARPNAVENVTFALVEGLVAEFSEEMDIVDYPVEKGDDDAATKMTDLKQFIAYKNRINMERKKWNRNFFLYGTGIWHTFWDPTWTGGRGPNRWDGDIRWMALHPQTFFPDARCKESIEDGRRCHKAFYRTQEEIEERYGVDVEPDMLRQDMLVGYDPDIMGASDVLAEPGEEQVLLVETWYKGEPLMLDKGEESQGAGMHVIWWCGDGNPVYLKHANYVYYNPDETPTFPFFSEQRYERENSIWGFGETHFLKSPQIVLNKTTEMILEGHMHFALGQTYYEEGSALTPKQKEMVENHGTLPGMWFPVKDINGVKREFGRGVPQSLQAEPDRLQKTMETIAGRFDISQGRTPGSVVAFRALDLLAARAQVRLRSAEKAMASSFEDCGNYINHLIDGHYTESRAYRILGDESEDKAVKVARNPATGEAVPYADGQPLPGPEWVVEQEGEGPKYGMFNAGDHKKVYHYDSDSVIPANEFMPDEFMQEGVDYEVYSPQFDVICKISTAMPTDRMFFMEVAKELFMQQLIDEETFWYVMKYGKLPPIEDLIAKAKERQVMQEKMMAMQAQAEQGGEMPPEGQAPPMGGDLMSQVEQIFQADPDLAQQFMSLTPEEQRATMQNIMAESGIA